MTKSPIHSTNRVYQFVYAIHHSISHPRDISLTSNTYSLLGRVSKIPPYQCRQALSFCYCRRPTLRQPLFNSLIMQSYLSSRVAFGLLINLGHKFPRSHHRHQRALRVSHRFDIRMRNRVEFVEFQFVVWSDVDVCALVACRIAVTWR